MDRNMLIRLVLMLFFGASVAGCSAASTTALPHTSASSLKPDSLCTNPLQCPAPPQTHLYVADTANNGFDVFARGATSSNEFVYHLTTSPVTGAASLSVDPSSANLYENDGATIGVFPQSGFDTQPAGSSFCLPASTVVKLANFDNGGKIDGVAFDGAGRFMAFGMNNAGSFASYTYDVAKVTGAIASPSPVGKLGVASNRFIIDPVAVAANPSTHIVYVADWVNGNIAEVSTAQAPLSDLLQPKCWITTPWYPNYGGKPVAMAYNAYNHLLYIVTKNGRIEAFADCSTTPSRDIGGAIPTGLVGYPWNATASIAADAESGTVSIYLDNARITPGSQNTVLSIGPDATGTTTPSSFTMPTGFEVGIAYGP